MILLKEKLLLRNVKSLKAERLWEQVFIEWEREREREIYILPLWLKSYIFFNFVFFTRGIKINKTPQKWERQIIF